MPTALTRFLGPAGPSRTLVEAQFISALGNGFFLTCFTLYVTRIVGLTPAQLGVGLSAAAIVGLFAGVPFGHLADQRGAREVAALLHVGMGVLIALLLVVQSFPLFVLTMCVYMFIYRGGAAAKAALTVGVLDGPVLVSARARIQAANNLGLSLGAAGAAIVLQLDTRAAYVSTLGFDGVSFVACGLFFLRLPRVPRSTPRGAGEPRLQVLRDRPYTLVSFINAVMLAHSPLLEVILPLWVVLHTDAPRSLVSALVVINTAAVVFFQVRIGERVDTLHRSVRAFRTAGFVLAAACVAYASSSAGGVWVAIGLLLLATVLHVLGEMVHSAGSWVVAYELAPAERQGQYQGLFSTGLAMSQILGPAALTLLLIDGGVVGWLVLAGIFAVVGLSMQPAARWAERTRPAAAKPEAQTDATPAAEGAS